VRKTILGGLGELVVEEIEVETIAETGLLPGLAGSTAELEEG